MTSVLRKIPIANLLVPPQLPEIPAPAPIVLPSPTAPDDERKAAQAAAAEKRKKIRAQGGRQKTILTGPLGAPPPLANITRKTLLGA